MPPPVDASTWLIVTIALDNADGLFRRQRAVVADLHGLATVTLVGRHELDGAVAVPVVVPIDK